MNDELPISAQVIVPPGDNEHIMQAAIAAAQMHANRRRDTRYYEQAVATPPSWLFGKAPETWWTKLRKWGRDAKREFLFFYTKNGKLIEFLIKYGSILYTKLAARQPKRARANLRRAANN